MNPTFLQQVPQHLEEWRAYPMKTAHGNTVLGMETMRLRVRVGFPPPLLEPAKHTVQRQVQVQQSLRYRQMDGSQIAQMLLLVWGVPPWSIDISSREIHGPDRQ